MYKAASVLDPASIEQNSRGALACGFGDDGGTLRIPRDHPVLELVPETLLLDAVVFGGSSAMVESQT